MQVRAFAMSAMQHSGRLLALILSLSIWHANAQHITANRTFDGLFQEQAFPFGGMSRDRSTCVLLKPACPLMQALHDNHQSALCLAACPAGDTCYRPDAVERDMLWH